MFKIHANQIEALRVSMFEDFLDRAVAHLRRVLAEQIKPFSDGALRQGVRSCVPRAARYGLTTEHEILCFMDATILIGEHFDENADHAQAMALLRDTNLKPDEKAGRVLEYACHRYWDKGTRS